MAQVRRVTSDTLSPADLSAIRALMDAAFQGRFDDHDWDHALGGTHVLAEDNGAVVAHACTVDRTLFIGDRRVATGYVEAVAVEPARQRAGLGTSVMREIARVIEERFELGALSTSSPAFYARLGWERWAGPTFAEAPNGRLRTADDDGGVMILRTPATERIDLRAQLTCDWRDGDVW